MRSTAIASRCFAVAAMILASQFVPNLKGAEILNLSFGELGTAPAQEIFNSEQWNNLTGSSGTTSGFLFADGSSAGAISATQAVSGTGFSGNNPNDAAGNGYVTGLDSVTTSLLFAGGGLGDSTSVTISGLDPGSIWDVDVFLGLNETPGRTLNADVNGTTTLVDIGATYSTNVPVTFSDIVADGSGEIVLTSLTTDANGANSVAILEAATLTSNAVPEPSTLVMFAAIGLCLGFGYVIRRRAKSSW